MMMMETCTLLDENHETVANLQNIVESCAVTGKLIHDANIVAVMQANGIKRLATHNLDDFKKFKHWIEITFENQGDLITRLEDVIAHPKS